MLNLAKGLVPVQERTRHLGEGNYPLPHFLCERIDCIPFTKEFWGIWKAVNPHSPPIRKQALLALDPGETTGVCYKPWDSDQLWLMQWDTKDVGQSFMQLVDFLEKFEPGHIRYEDYKVYSWKAADHANASLHTPQWIGAIRAASSLADIPYSCKMAQQPKGWWTDEKLKRVGMYNAGLKHARDALRHMLFMLCFPNRTDEA